MSITLDATLTGDNSSDGDTHLASNTTSASTTKITVASGATILLVSLALQRLGGSGPTGVTCTWDGGAPTDSLVANNGNCYAAFFWWNNPTPGAKTIAASWTNVCDCYIGAISLNGSGSVVTADNQTSTSGGSTATVTIPTANGDITLATSMSNANEPTVSFTKFWGDASLNPGGDGDYHLSTGSSDAHTFTWSGGNDAVAAGVHVAAAGGGGQTDITGTPAKVTTKAAVGQVGGESVDITGTPATVTALANVGVVNVTIQIAKVADRGARNSTSAGDATLTITNPTLIAVGNYLVARVSVDNSGSSGARPGLAVTDSRSHTWTAPAGALQDPSTASAGVAVYLCYVKVVTPFQAGDTILFDYTTGSPLSAIVLEEWTGINKTTPLAVAQNTANNVSSTAQPSIARTPTAAGQLMYVAAGIEGISSSWGSQDSDTTNGSWAEVTKDEANTGTGSTSQSVYGGYKIVTASGAQTWNNTLGVTSDWAACAVVFAVEPNPANLSGTAAKVVVKAGVAQIGIPVDLTGIAAKVTVKAGVASIGPSTVLYPVSVSGRKWLDQNGDVFLVKSCSSWSLAENATDAEMDEFLEAVAALGFNAVTVSLPGHRGPNGTGWNWQTNQAGDPYWTTTDANDQWNTALGAGWASYDHLLAKLTELGMIVILSLYTGSSDGSGSPPTGNEGVGPVLQWQYGRLGAGTYLPALEDIGEAIATRFADYPNIVWHLGADKEWFYGTLPNLALPVDAFFHGLANIEGGTPRLHICEPVDPAISDSDSALTQFDDDFDWFTPLSADSSYYRQSTPNDSVNAWNYVYATLGFTAPVWDCEPPYIEGSGYNRQQFRQRPYVVFLRNGIGINWGYESITGFDQGSWYGNDTVAEALASDEIADASRAWALVDAYCKDPAWVPDSGTFLTTGLGTGAATAASGRSDTAAIAHFPSSRTIAVDTTVIAGSGNVRLRWYDPVLGTYSTIAASEAQQSGRSVTYPSNHGDGSTDWVLVVDAVAGTTDITGTPAKVVVKAAVGAAGGQTDVTGTPAKVTVKAAIGVATGEATVTGTPAKVIAKATIGAAVGNATATGTPAVVTVKAAIGQVGAGIDITGTSAVVTVKAAVGVTTGEATVTGTSAVVTVKAGVGSLSSAVDISGTPAVVTVKAAVGVVTGNATVTGTPAVVTVKAAVGPVAATQPITGTPAVVVVKAAVGSVSGELSGLPAKVVVKAGVAPVAATQPITGTPAVVVVKAGVGSLAATVNITGTPAKVTVKAGPDVVTGYAAVAGTTAKVAITAGIGQVVGQANLLGLAAVVVVLAGIMPPDQRPGIGTLTMTGSRAALTMTGPSGTLTMTGPDGEVTIEP